MNATTRTLLFKFLMTLVFSTLTLWLFNQVPFSMVFLFSITTTAINYIIGDLILLPSMGNLAASIADGLIIGIAARIYDMISTGFNTTFPVLIALGIILAIGEYYFHQFLLRSGKVAP